MRIYIPEIGDKIKLTKDWSFELHLESRNRVLYSRFLDLDPEKIRYSSGLRTGTEIPFEYEGRPIPSKINISLPKGTVLQIDRVYIRQKMQEYSSLSFIIEECSLELGEGKGFGHKKHRFWAKLVDVNTMNAKRL